MQGAISTPHRLATEAGNDVFTRGGNAIDAALAAAAVLTVVYPHQCALGGDLFALVDTGEVADSEAADSEVVDSQVDSGAGEVLAINGSGAAPLGVDVEALRKEYDQVPDAGPHAITVPGVVAGWQSISQQAGQLGWDEVLAPAIELAEQGVAVSPSLAAGIKYRMPVMDDAMRDLFVVNGQPLSQGDQLVQPALANTLRTLADQGLETFYSGAVGKQLAQGLEKLGCALTYADLQGHQTEITEPLALDYQGFELLTSPPNSQGFVLFETLAALEAIGVRLDPSGPGAGYLLHACLMAAADRETLLGDPRRVSIPLERLLDKTTLAPRMHDRMERRIEKQMENDSTVTINSQAAHGDTVAVCAMDSEGRAVSLIQSVFQTFGAAVLEPETGVIFHNRARGFSLQRGAPNELIPGTRPAHSLMPLLLRRRGRQRMQQGAQQQEARQREGRQREGTLAVLGTMGGKAQPQILAQILAGAMDSKQTPTEILARPRWVVGARDIDFATPTVAIEADAPVELDTVLRIEGLDVARIAACSESVGHAQIVRREDDGALAAAADPRSDGSAAIYSSS